MRMWVSIFSAFLLLGFAATTAYSAESKAVQTMGGILLTLNHFPSDSDKQSLKQIAEDESATRDERTIARALMNVQHTAAEADKPKLEAILKDEKASDSSKTLASVILNLKHTPSSSDKEKLQRLIS